MLDLFGTGETLTRDNFQLSKPTNKPELSNSAINCTYSARTVQDYSMPLTPRIQNVPTRQTSRISKLWGGTVPCSPERLADVSSRLRECRSAAINVAAPICRDLARACHREARQTRADPNWCEHVLRGIKRTHGTACRGADPLLKNDLLSALNLTGSDLRACRDRALLLVGFAGALRRSELIGLDVSDLRRVEQGYVVTIRTSKTDQERTGRRIGIPSWTEAHCPAGALDQWLFRAGISNGPVFRAVNRHGQVGTGRLSAATVCSVVKERLGALGIDPSGFTGHSLRAGFVTSSARAGVPHHKIQQQTGHRSLASLGRYVREVDLF